MAGWGEGYCVNTKDIKICYIKILSKGKEQGSTYLSGSPG